MCSSASNCVSHKLELALQAHWKWPVVTFINARPLHNDSKQNVQHVSPLVCQTHMYYTTLSLTAAWSNTIACNGGRAVCVTTIVLALSTTLWLALLWLRLRYRSRWHKHQLDTIFRVVTGSPICVSCCHSRTMVWLHVTYRAVCIGKHNIEAV